MQYFKSTLFYISNIPNSYHAKHLRVFFECSVERDKFVIFHFRHRPELINFNGDFNGFNLKPKKYCHSSLCAFCIIKDHDINLFLKYYNGKHWLHIDSYDPVETKCNIIKCQWIESSKLIELDAPLNLPYGNVGTPTKFFLDEIHKCTVSMNVIRKLKLKMGGRTKKKLYTRVGMNYDNPMSKVQYLNESHDFVLMDDEEYDLYVSTKTFQDDYRDVLVEDSEIIMDDEEEEWERFENLHDDAHDLTKSKKCMLEFERKEEITWEKGGPGAVFYTDAAFWREEELEDDKFDEEGFWDFDVDTEDHLEEAKKHQKMMELIDSVEERREVIKRKKNCFHKISKKSNFNPKVTFKYDKKINISETALRIMEKYGWQHNVGLGPESNRGVRSFSEISQSDFLPQSKEKEGLKCDEERLGRSDLPAVRKFDLYGSDKNVSLRHFVPFIPSLK